MKIAIFTKKDEILLNLVIFRQDRDSRSENVNILLEFIGKMAMGAKGALFSQFPRFSLN